MNNLQEVLDNSSLKHPNKIAIRFLSKGEEETDSISFSKLQERAKIVASQLLTQVKEGDKALLLFEPGIDFIVAFWGCVYANIISVPVSAYHSDKNVENISHIIENTKASLIISHDSVHTLLYKKLKVSKKIDWFLESKNNNTKNVDFTNKVYNPDSTVYLQYTSGSTSKPKGVMISHKNILANEKVIKQVFNNTEESVLVSWLPHYHDMGLVKIIQATYCGAVLIFMPPIAFVQKPFRWLETISKYKGTFSASPNFGYEDCLRSVSDEELDTLDLSTWERALNAAEPVSASTHIRFIQKFSQCGFRYESLNAGYGMAEATLVITMTPLNKKTKLLALDSSEFRNGYIKVLDELYPDSKLANIKKYEKIVVDCGRCIPGHDLKIVNPENSFECASFEIGEVLFAGDSISKGYWENEKATQEVFNTKYKNNIRSQVFLNTGDLGFVDNDKNLFIVGRRKDMLIINGKNYAPQDIEISVLNSNTSFVENSCAAFSVMVEEVEKVVIVQEIKRTQRKKVDYEKLLLHVKSILVKEHQLQLFALVFINQARLPKTSSGKIQRSLCKKLFVNKKFEDLYTWQLEEVNNSEILNIDFTRKEPDSCIQSVELSHDNLLNFLENWIKENIPSASSFDKSNDFSSYGVDSKLVVQMIYHLENFIKYELEPTLCWNYPTPEALVNYILNEIRDNNLSPILGK